MKKLLLLTLLCCSPLLAMEDFFLEESREVYEQKTIETEFLCAAKNSDLSAIKHYLELGVDINFADENGWTALHIALNKKAEEIDEASESFVAFLINNGANPNLAITDGESKGITPIHMAIAAQSKKFVTLLLNGGASLDIPITSGKYEGWTPLTSAIRAKNKEIVALLIDNKVDLNLQNKGCTPLCMSLNSDAPEIMQLLLDKGARPDDLINIENEWQTALHLAVINNLENETEMLLKAKADPNFVITKSETTKGWSLIHFAAAADNTKIIKLLLKYGADPNLPIADGESKGFTPLAVAMEKLDKKIIKILLKSGADPNLPIADGKSKGFTPFTVAISRLTENTDYDDEIIKLLLDYDADPNLVITNGQLQGFTPLCMAITSKCDEKIIKLLLEYGADPNFISTKLPEELEIIEGFTALHLAIHSNCNKKIIKLLLHYGANPSTIIINNDEKNTIISFIYKTAFSKGLKGEGFDVDIPLFIKAGTNIHIENQEEDTGLDIAIHLCEAKTAQLLIAAKTLQLGSAKDTVKLIKKTIKEEDNEEDQAIKEEIDQKTLQTLLGSFIAHVLRKGTKKYYDKKITKNSSLLKIFKLNYPQADFSTLNLFKESMLAVVPPITLNSQNNFELITECANKKLILRLLKICARTDLNTKMVSHCIAKLFLLSGKHQNNQREFKDDMFQLRSLAIKNKNKNFAQTIERYYVASKLQEQALAKEIRGNILNFIKN